jgi:hypothetical protein
MKINPAPSELQILVRGGDLGTEIPVSAYPNEIN